MYSNLKKFIKSPVQRLITIFSIIVISIIIFDYGLWGHQKLILTKSTQADLSHKPYWFGSQYKRVIYLLIDGLGFEDAYYNASKPINPIEPCPETRRNLYFLNKLEEHPETSKLYKVRQHPPPYQEESFYTYMTGDISNIHEIGPINREQTVYSDNLLNQMLANSKTVHVFAAQDRWRNNMKDKFLHINYMINYNEVEDIVNSEEDWNMLFIHDETLVFHEPCQGSFKDRLELIDEKIHKIARQMDNDTIIMIGNTFGRDNWGNHFGCKGNFAKECEGFLGVMAKDGFGAQDLMPDNLKVKEPLIIGIEDVDIVPTISSLMGIPIPYVNLGNIIIEFYREREESAYYYSVCEHIWINLQQVYRYYDQMRGRYLQFEHEEKKHIKVTYDKIQDLFQNFMVDQREKTIEKFANNAKFRKNMLKMGKLSQGLIRYMKRTVMEAKPYGPTNMIIGIVIICALPVIGLIMLFIKLKKNGELKLFFTTNDDNEFDLLNFGVNIAVLGILATFAYSLGMQEEFKEVNIITRVCIVYMIALFIKACLDFKKGMSVQAPLLNFLYAFLLYVTIIILHYYNDEFYDDQWRSQSFIEDIIVDMHKANLFSNDFVQFYLPWVGQIIVIFRIVQTMRRANPNIMEIVYVLAGLWIIILIFAGLDIIFLTNGMDSASKFVKAMSYIVAGLGLLVQYIGRRDLKLSWDGHLLVVMANITLPIVLNHIRENIAVIMISVYIVFNLSIKIQRHLKLMSSLQFHLFFGALSFFYYRSLGYTYDLKVMEVHQGDEYYNWVNNVVQWKGLQNFLNVFGIFAIFAVMITLWNKVIYVVCVAKQPFSLHNLMYTQVKKKQDTMLKHTFKYFVFFYIHFLFLAIQVTKRTFDYDNQIFLQHYYESTFFVCMIIFLVTIVTLFVINLAKAIHKEFDTSDEKEEYQAMPESYQIKE